MNITFLIGNGFDLNLGLPTDYTSFLEYHEAKGRHDMISRAIREDQEIWSNVEAALGVFTEKLDSENVGDFSESKCLLDESLSDYLEQISSSNTLRVDDAGAAEFRDKLIGISKEFSEEDRLFYTSTVQQVSENISYCFISFNYTKYLDTIIGAGKKLSPFHSRSLGGSTYKDGLLDPVHVHGTLGENVLLGVNDASQLSASDEIKRSISPLMIKPNMNAALGERRTEKAKDLINSSRYVFIHGMSLGRTDSMWWELIAKWLKGSNNRRVVLYVYSPNINKRSASRTLIFQNEKRDEFLKAANCTDSEISKQIIVIPNTKVFSYEHIAIEHKQADERAEAV